MLKYILVFIISLIINKLDAKPWQYPDCMDLEVSEINFINNDTLLVTVYNQCNSCIQHQYTSLTAYLNEDTIAVEDMIASKPSPANNDEYTYTLLIKKPLQITNGLWFEMLFICDSLKHADNLVVNLPPNIILQEDTITINPDFKCNQIGIGGDFTNYDIHIEDEFNNIITNFAGASNPIIINTADFENHYLTIQHQSIENVRFRTMVSSCDSDGGETATPQFNLFSDSLLTFEYYFNLEGERPVEELLLHPVEGLEIVNQIYTGFSAPNSVVIFTTNGDILDYNFPPIRYENGNYYERRYYGEVVVLKDEVNVGDVWSTEFITVFGDTISYAFEVTAFYESYNEFGIDYENVFQLKETVYYSNGNSSQISLHYYNKEYGIISRETPPYVSGTYGPLKFNRIIGNVNLSEVSLEDAQANQFISFTIEERDILITEFKENPTPFNGAIVGANSIEFDVNEQYPLSRAIYAFVPEDQVEPGHVETIGLEFNQVFSLSDLNTDLTKLTSNEQFRNEFIQAGSQNPMLTKFGFHQTYLIGYGQPVEITKVESVIDHPDKIFISGTFSGLTMPMPFDIGEMSNGQFKVLIEN